MASRTGKARAFDADEVTEAQLLPRIGSEEEYNPDMEAAFEQLKEDFRQQHSEGTLWVYRVPLDDRGELIANAKNVYLFSAPIQRYSTEEIYSKVQREFMTGLAVTCIRVAATKRGERGMRFNQLVMVEAPAQAKDAKPADTGGGLQLGSLGEIVRVIQEGQQAMLALVQRALHQPTVQQPPGPSQIDNLRSLAEIVFLLNGGGPKAASAAQAPPTVLEQLKTLRELRGFVGELAGDGSDGGGETADGPLAVLKHLSPWAQVFGRLLANPAQPAPQLRRVPRPAPPLQPAPGAPLVPAPAPAAASPGIAPMTPVQPSLQPTDQGADPVLLQLRSEFEALTRAAADGGTPEDVAPVVLQMIPEGSPQEALFLGFLEDGEWFRKLAAIYPPARQYEDWFHKLRAAILAEYEDEAGATDQPVQS